LSRRGRRDSGVREFKVLQRGPFQGKRVLFRDTLRLEHLDLNEVQGTVEALSLAMAEHAAELIAFSQQ